MTRTPEYLELVHLLHKASEIANSVENQMMELESYQAVGCNEGDQDDTLVWHKAQEAIEALQDALYLNDAAENIEQLVAAAIDENNRR
tara:strand:+ start:169 stop:432 length:264 start_codon:yes stop_codon:yes gene_type:complete